MCVGGGSMMRTGTYRGSYLITHTHTHTHTPVLEYHSWPRWLPCLLVPEFSSDEGYEPRGVRGEKRGEGMEGGREGGKWGEEGE